MFLSKDQESILAGEHGPVLERSLRLLTRLGDIYGAEKMIPVGSVQVAGVSYKSIGEPGLEFLQDMAAQGARVKVLTFLNPAGMDLEDWEKMGFPKDFAGRQMAIMDAFKQMGIVITSTCTPYLAGNLPRYREHIAWSESSAVSFSNSVIGARTNREGGPSALAAALCGVTPDYGLHRDENRVPDIVVDVEASLGRTSDYGALGWVVGKAVKNRIPFYRGLPENSSTDHLKAMGAASAASGAVALWHGQDITPEAERMDTSGLETMTITDEDLRDAYETLSTACELDIVILGCPHASLRELGEAAGLVCGRKLKKPFWVCTSRVVKEASDRMGYTQTIEDAGGRVVADTCMVVSPIEDMGFKNTGVNSGKAANYLPSFCKQGVVFKDMRSLIEEVLE